MATDSSSRAGVWTTVASLFTSLAYYTVLARYARTIVGTTAGADTTIAVVFLLSTAVGAVAGRRALLRERTRTTYPRAELMLVIYCMGFPFLIPWLSGIYLAMAPSILDASPVARHAARFAFTTLAFFVPGYLMGVTVDRLSRTLGPRSVVWMTTGAALGLLASADVLVPRIGLVATLALASIVKLGVAAIAAIAPLPETGELSAPRSPAPAEPLPWRRILTVVMVAALVLGMVFFRSLLAFVLQNPVVLPAAGTVILTAAWLVRRGFELSPGSALLFAVFVSGGLVCAVGLVSPYGASVVLAMAMGALAGGRLSRSRRWAGSWLMVAGAGVLAALAFGAGVSVVWVVPLAIGAMVSRAARSAGGAGVVYAVFAGGAALSAVGVPTLLIPSVGAGGSLPIIGSLLLFVGGVTMASIAEAPRRRGVAALAMSAIVWGPLLPLRTEIPGNEAEPVRAEGARDAGAHIAALLTPGRTSALIGGGDPEAEVYAALGFARMVSAPRSECNDSEQRRCLLETARSVLFESARRYDVIAIGGSCPRELYDLAARRLRRHGVLVQRLSIRAHSPRRVFTVLNTARSALPYVSLWSVGDSAIIVASNEPLLIDVASLRSSSSWASKAFASGSPLELLRELVIAGDDMDRALDAMAALVDEVRATIATDNLSLPATDERKESTELQNRALFDRIRSPEPFGFRGNPTNEETMLARAAFARDSLPRLARSWDAGAEASLAASTWLYDELSGNDARELRADLGLLTALTATADSTTSCEPIPRFVSRVARVPLSVLDHSGESLDGTEPTDAIDGTFDPSVGKGWRARPEGRAITLDVALAPQTDIETVNLVVRPLDGSVAHTRLFGRDSNGRWHPLAADSEPRCVEARRFHLSASTPPLSRLRVTVHGDVPGAGFALHELWAEGS